MLTARLVELSLLSPFTNSLETVSTRSAMILELSHDDITAYSECVCDSSSSSTGERNETALRLIRGELARMIQEGPIDPLEFVEEAKPIRGNQMAKAAVETLLWDYRAKEMGLPLDKSLGRSRGYAEAGVAIGMAPTRDLVSRVGDALDQGYKRVKVKVDRESAKMNLEALRDAYPSAPLSADANGCFDLQRDLSLLERLDHFGLQYIEQPLQRDDIDGHSRLAKHISTPICLDESVESLADAEEVLEKGAAEVINVKPGRLGGLSVAIEVARLARKSDAHVWIGGMHETGVGRALNVALASQEEVDLPGDTSPNSKYFARDIVSNPFEMRSGRIVPNEGAGLGIDLDEPSLKRATVRSWKVI
jgi:O-succinylbenzoate synthase